MYKVNTMSDNGMMSSNNCNHFTNMDLQDENENDGKPKTYKHWKDECYQFAQETTLHGLKYISMKNTFLIRRLFWLILTCFCCGIMSYQIIDRIIYYYDSPITVNVKVNYNRSLIFPSVTVCNQNAYRATAAAINSWYRLIETMYNGSASSFDQTELQKYNVSELRLSDLFTKAGHHKEDLIVGDFPTTMTFFCYQSDEQYKGLTKLLGHLNRPVAIERVDEYSSMNLFIASPWLFIFEAATWVILFSLENNSGHDSLGFELWKKGVFNEVTFPLICTQQEQCNAVFQQLISLDFKLSSLLKKLKYFFEDGADQGLKLFLNVEQYEYMPGPNDAAGIKLLTYDKSDIPRMKELGISIPTGIHAFVGLQMLVIKNLRVPYGECQERQLQYSSQYSTDACVIECLNRLTESKCGCKNYFIPSNGKSGRECTIDEYYSCYKNNYKLFRDIHQDQCSCPTACFYTVFDPIVSYASTSEYSAESKLSMVSTDLLQQKVLNSREVAHRMEKRKVDKFMKIVNNLDESFKEVLTKFGEVEKKISSYLTFMDSRYVTDKKAWDRKTRLYRYQIYHVRKNFIRPRDAMEERTLSNLCVGFHEFVFMVETNLKHLSSADMFDSSVRASIYTLTRDAILSQVETADRALANVTQLYNAYQNGTPIFRYRFENIMRERNEFITPKKLLADSLVHNSYARRYGSRFKSDIIQIQKSLQQFINILMEVNLTQTFNISRFETAKNLYIDNCEDFYHSKSVFYMECIERPLVILEKRLDKFQQNISDYMSTREFIMNNLGNLKDSINNSSQFELLYIKSFLSYLKDYPLPNSTITKKGLSNYVLSELLLKQISRCDAIFQEIRNRGQNIYDGLTALVIRVSNIWQDIILDEDMQDYYEYRGYWNFLVNWTALQNSTNIEITEARNINALRPIVGNVDKKLASSFETLRDHMKEFRASTKIDDHFLRENFLQIDVFYRELSYEEIEQQEAYDIFALLCDIGGSMGLFIGASVMTIFEIADFVLDLSAKNALYKRKRRRQH